MRVESNKNPIFFWCPLADAVVSAVSDQVWSLTQFYSVDFLQSRITEEKFVFSTNTQSRFASVVLDAILEPPFIAEHTQQRPSFSAVPEAMHEASQGPLNGAVSAQKDFKGPR